MHTDGGRWWGAHVAVEEPIFLDFEIPDKFFRSHWRTRGSKGRTSKLTGAGARSAKGTDMGHENAEGMAHVGARVERPVRRALVK